MNKYCLLLGVSALSMNAFSAKPKQPNIIFIMSDDHTSKAIGAYGSRLAGLNPTPTIDRIGNEGIIFNNAFCTNSISTPSRACIISGQYGHKTGVYDLSNPLSIDKQYLPIEMKKLGYQTAIIGKWHLHNPPEQFDYYNVFYGQGDYFDPILGEKNSKDSMMINYFGERKMRPAKKYKGHSSDIVTDLTLDWLKNKRKKNQPFFLMHHFKAPHDKFEYHPRYEEYLKDVFIPEPESMWDNKNNGSAAVHGVNNTWINIIGTSVGKRNKLNNMGVALQIDPSLSDKEYKRAAYQKYLKSYLRCVKGVDDNVKRLFDYLEKEGLMDNTIIVYTGDQGFMLGEHDYIDKRWMYEECMRMPFMVRYPKKIKGGIKTDAIVNNVDYAPTIISLAGGEVPEYMQGDSFKELLYTGQEPKGWKQATYYRYWMHMIHHYNPGHFGIRTKDYKLIFFYGCDYTKRDKGNKQYYMSTFNTEPGWEFYDLRKDPKEMNNCYNDPAYKDIIAKLKTDLKALRAEVGEDDSQFPQIQERIDANWNK